MTSDDRSGYHVRGAGYTLPQVWDGDTCITDRVFNGYAEKIVKALQAMRDKQEAGKCRNLIEKASPR